MGSCCGCSGRLETSEQDRVHTDAPLVLEGLRDRSLELGRDMGMKSLMPRSHEGLGFRVLWLGFRV